MTRILAILPCLLLPCLLLAACSRPAPAPEPVSTPTAALPPPVIDHWPGKYEGDLMVRILGTPGAHKVVLVAATADGCTGDIGLAGGESAKDLSSTEMSVSVKTDTNDICTLHLRTEGAKIVVAETDACQAFHGKTCSFNGSAIKLHR